MEWRWGTSPRKDMGPVEVLWDEDGVPSPREQTETYENSTFPSYYVCGREILGNDQWEMNLGMDFYAYAHLMKQDGKAYCTREDIYFGCHIL